jgi:hypothetical protein
MPAAGPLRLDFAAGEAHMSAMDFSIDGIMWSIVLGAVGMGLFMYGKKQERYPQLIGGIAFMVCPYLVSGTAWNVGATAAIIAGMVLAVNAGY